MGCIAALGSSDNDAYLSKRLTKTGIAINLWLCMEKIKVISQKSEMGRESLRQLHVWVLYNM